LYKRQYTFLILSRSFLLKLRNVSDKICRENRNIYFMLGTFFLELCRLWPNVKNFVEPCRPQMIMWYMRISYWIPKATDAHSEYVTLITLYCNNGLLTRLNVPLYAHCLSCFNAHLAASLNSANYWPNNLTRKRYLPDEARQLCWALQQTWTQQIIWLIGLSPVRSPSYWLSYYTVLLLSRESSAQAHAYVQKARNETCIAEQMRTNRIIPSFIS